MSDCQLPSMVFQDTCQTGFVPGCVDPNIERTALDACSEQERRQRHRQNYMHITAHTSQVWADTFISELNDTHVEAELRTKHIPPLVSTNFLHLAGTSMAWPLI